MTEVIEINDIHGLTTYEADWNRLLTQTRGGTFFQSLDWLRVYWKHFAGDQKLRVLIVKDGGQPTGIVPLTVMREQTRIGKIRVLTYPLHDWATFYGPISGDSQATLTAALEHVRRTRRDWDMSDLRWVDRDGSDGGQTGRALQAAGLRGQEMIYHQTGIIDTATTWEKYLSSRTAKFRNNLRRAIRRTHELGDIRFDRYRPLGSGLHDDDPRWELYDECVALAERTWQGSSLTGTTLSSDTVRDYFRDAHEAAAKAGALDLCTIKLDGKVIAFGYNYHSLGHVYGMRIGYEPVFRQCALGNVLYAETIRTSCELGDHAFDMGVGSMDIKLPWLTQVKNNYRYPHYSLTAPRTQVLRLKHWLKRRTDNRVPAANDSVSA